MFYARVFSVWHQLNLFTLGEQLIRKIGFHVTANAQLFVKTILMESEFDYQPGQDFFL